MADEEKKEVKRKRRWDARAEKFIWGQGFLSKKWMNLTGRRLTKIKGGPVLAHKLYREMQSKEITALENLNRKLKGYEGFGGLEKGSDDEKSRGSSQYPYLEKTIKYNFIEPNFRMMGPYIQKDIADKEYHWIEHGTGIDRKSARFKAFHSEEEIKEAEKKYNKTKDENDLPGFNIPLAEAVPQPFPIMVPEFSHTYTMENVHFFSIDDKDIQKIVTEFRGLIDAIGEKAKPWIKAHIKKRNQEKRSIGKFMKMVENLAIKGRVEITEDLGNINDDTRVKLAGELFEWNIEMERLKVELDEVEVEIKKGKKEYEERFEKKKTELKMERVKYEVKSSKSIEDLAWDEQVLLFLLRNHDGKTIKVLYTLFNKALGDQLSEEANTNIDKNVNEMKDGAFFVLNQKIMPILQENAKMYKESILNPLLTLHDEYLKTWDQVFPKNRPEKDQIIYHEYKHIINVYAEGIKTFWNDYSGRKVTAIIDYKKGTKVEMDEEGPGLDEFGMPHEVMRIHGKWVLSLDYYKHKYYGISWSTTTPVRWLENKDMKKYCMRLYPIDAVSYVHDQWDEVRDTIRDGRYHSFSSQAIDYAMAMAPFKARGEEWKPLNVRKFHNAVKKDGLSMDRRIFTIRLMNKEIISGTRGPSNISPCLDLTKITSSGSTQNQDYPGKLYYYGPYSANSSDLTKWHDIDKGLNPNNKLHEQRIGGHVTTRGLSHYIIGRAFHEIHSIDEMEGYFDKVAKKTGGFDYGPRSFGHSFPMSPFKVDIRGVTDRTLVAKEPWGPGNKDKWEGSIQPKNVDHIKTYKI